MNTEPSNTEAPNTETRSSAPRNVERRSVGSKATERTSTDDTLGAWAAALADELGLPDGPPTDLATVLDLARDAARGIARPAAPLTTFLVGYAAGLHGGGSKQLTAAIETARRLADDIQRTAVTEAAGGDTQENPDDHVGAPR